MTHKEKLCYLLYDLSIELADYDLSIKLADGVHTYHECECGKPARRSKCAECLVREFKEK